MSNPGLSDEVVIEAAKALERNGGDKSAASRELGIPRGTFTNRIRRAAERGFMGYSPVLPGYAIKSVATKTEDGEWIKQVKAPSEEPFSTPEGHAIKGVSALVGPDGRVVQQWIKTREDAEFTIAAQQAAVEALKEDLPRATPVEGPDHRNELLVNQFTVTDLHFGMLAWAEETRAEDYDLKIAEQLLLDWFEAAVAMAPPAHTAILAQLGDLLHHDSHTSVTPEHRHVLDADSRLQKVIRVIIRTLRRVISMLLETHEHVHIIMADANHDPASEAWLRELFATFYEDEPRVTVDDSPSTYYAYEHGDTSLFYHHGHKRGAATIDSVVAGLFRDIYGRTKFSYCHIGHNHSDELKTTNLMKVERHETLAAPDAYNALGGWLSNRSAKVITYHKAFGEVSRIRISPQMVQQTKDDEREAA